MMPFSDLLGDQLTRPIQPWQVDRSRLFSWLEMLQFSANAFVLCGKALREIRADCLLNAIIAPADEPLFAMYSDLSDHTTNKTARLLTLVEERFREIGL